MSNTTIFILTALVAVAGWWFWRWRRAREGRMVSLVALLRAPVTFDPVVLARTAGKAWSADLGDGDSEGEDGVVVGTGRINTIIHGDRFYLINCLPNPYVEDVEGVCESIGESRIRRLFAEHRAWFSCDALGVDHRTPSEEVTECYRRLAKLFVEFLDENCLLIFVPDTGRAYPINDETERALLSDEPLASLQATQTVPIVQVSADDPAMLEAVAQARGHWPRFVAAFEEQAGSDFGVKAPVTHADTTEFIWLKVTALEGGQIYGTLANHPSKLGPLKLGSKVSVALAELNDWCYLDREENPQGLFTLAAVQNAQRRGGKT